MWNKAGKVILIVISKCLPDLGSVPKSVLYAELIPVKQLDFTSCTIEIIIYRIDLNYVKQYDFQYQSLHKIFQILANV